MGELGPGDGFGQGRDIVRTAFENGENEDLCKSREAGRVHRSEIQAMPRFTDPPSSSFFFQGSVMLSSIPQAP